MLNVIFIVEVILFSEARVAEHQCTRLMCAEVLYTLPEKIQNVNQVHAEEF